MKMRNLDSSSGMPASIKELKNTVLAMKVLPNNKPIPLTMRMSNGMDNMPPKKAFASDLIGSFWYLS